MANSISRSVSAIVLGCGLLLECSLASAGIITLLRDNFNDTTGLNAPGDVRTVADILANNPGQLPAGTTVLLGSPNVRRVDDPINMLGGNNGFHNFFGSNFLVLGDDSGPIGGNPSGLNEDTGIRFPFEIPVGALGIQIRYRVAFNGVDTATNRTDFLRVRLTGPGDTVNVQTLSSPVDFGAGTFISSFFDVFVDLNPATLSPGQYQLQFRLDEDSNGNGQTNTAVGLDRIRITAEIPEPATLPLLAAGLGGLVALRGRKALWAARIF